MRINDTRSMRKRRLGLCWKWLLAEGRKVIDGYFERILANTGAGTASTQADASHDARERSRSRGGD
jgi:hypothetical protein